jgi:hypothetical protein
MSALVSETGSSRTSTNNNDDSKAATIGVEVIRELESLGQELESSRLATTAKNAQATLLRPASIDKQQTTTTIVAVKAPSPAITTTPLCRPKPWALKRRLIGLAAIIGWGLLAWFVAVAVCGQVTHWYSEMTKPAPCNVFRPPYWPTDPLDGALRHPLNACYQHERDARARALHPLYPIVRFRAPKEPVIAEGVVSSGDDTRRISSCITIHHLSEALQRLAQNRQTSIVFSIGLEKKGHYAAGNNTARTTGLQQQVDFARMRYSLQILIWQLDLDFLCAQHLGIPLCYCVWRRSESWIDVLGRVNLTCLGSHKMVVQTGTDLLCSEEQQTATTTTPPPMVITQRFKHVCMSYVTSQNMPIDEALTLKDAVIAQHIYKLQRGRVSCDTAWLSSPEGTISELNETFTLFHTEHEQRV